MTLDQPETEPSIAADPRVRFGLAVGVAVLFHIVVLWALGYSISFQLPVEPPLEPKIVLVAPTLSPPPPDVETIGPVDVMLAVPRFRPRVPAVVPQRQQREGDPALAVWSYLCNRDYSLSQATRVGCPPDLSGFDFSLLDPLNRSGDIGALLGTDTTTMSLDEAATKRGWVKPKSPLQADGARAKDSGVGPGHDPFAILPGHAPIR